MAGPETRNHTGLRGVVSCFVMELFCRKKTNLRKWMRLPEGQFNKCVFTVASLHSVDEEPVAVVRGQDGW